MKLTAHIFRVKQVSLLQAFIISLTSGLGLLVLWTAIQDEDARIEHYGNTLADAFAAQVVEPFMTRDLIHLGVLTNRIIELPEVIGATIHTVDDEMLTLSGDAQRGRAFIRQIIHDNATRGIVRIHIDEGGFGTGAPLSLVIASLLWVGMVPLLTLAVGRLSLGQYLTRNRPGGQAVDDVEPVAEPEPEPELWYLITVNLFNQLSLPPERAAREIAFARRTAGRIAKVYNGEVDELPGTGLLLSFRKTSNDDRPFHVLCAAFALSRLLEQAESWGRYRLGVHMVTLESDQHPVPGDEAVADSAVLSALTKDNSIVVSRVFFDAIAYPQRVDSVAMTHMLLEELETIGGDAVLARGLAEPHDELVAQQVVELAYSERSTASESTF